MAAEAGASEGPAGVILLVCMECGREVQFEEGERPPSDMECEKCGNQVFRRFDAGSADEARAEFREETERDMDTNDPATDTERGDILDVNNP